MTEPLPVVGPTCQTCELPTVYGGRCAGCEALWGPIEVPDEDPAPFAGWFAPADPTETEPQP